MNTYDFVILGAYNGSGKLSDVYGSFLLGCKDDNNEYIPCCKVGTGLTYEILEKMTSIIDNCEKDSNDLCINIVIIIDHSYKPDICLKPKIIVEITFSSYSLSPKSIIGKNIIINNKGISFRFPRFIRIRDDKKLDDITSYYNIN